MASCGGIRFGQEVTCWRLMGLLRPAPGFRDAIKLDDRELVCLSDQADAQDSRAAHG